MSDTGSGGSHSHATKPGGGTYAAGSHLALLDAERAEVARLRADNAVLSDAMVDRNMDRWDRGVAWERARIAAEVKGLPADITVIHQREDEPVRAFVSRAAVLAIVRGVKPEPVRDAMKRLGIPLPSEDVQQRRVDEVTRKPMPGDMDDA